MGVPEVRSRLYELAQERGDDELAALADGLWRKPFMRRAEIHSTPFTKRVAAQIRAYARANPSAPYEEIARYHNVNIGRVNDALNNRK